MRIAIGIILVVIGLPLFLASSYRVSQIGETLLIYPLQNGPNRLGPITLSPAMNPIEVRLNARWTHHHRLNSRDALSGEVTLTDPSRQVMWKEKRSFSVPDDESSPTSPVNMKESNLIRTFEVDQKGPYQFDILVRKARSTGRHISIQVDMSQHPHTWQVPLVSGGMSLVGLILILWGAHLRKQKFKDPTTAITP